MYISQIRVSELRSYHKIERLKFEYPGQNSIRSSPSVSNVTLLLGTNGAGKTTILKAIALSLLGPVIQDSGFKPECLIRRIGGTAGTAKEDLSGREANIQATVELHGQDLGIAEEFESEIAMATATATVKGRGDYESVTATYSKKSGHVSGNESNLDIEGLFNDASPAYFVVGYGATRRVASPNSSELHQDRRRGLRYQRVAGLFEDYVTLFPMKLWLPELGRKSESRFMEVGTLVNDLLPSDARYTGQFDDLQPIFVYRGTALPFTALSDGYRGFIGVISDLLYHLHLACPESRKLTDLAGVVLIDDIDLHLHPSWQRTVLQTLSSAFPKLQFVVTSHSPLVLSSLYAANVRLIESPPIGPSTVTALDERVHGLNADQLLTSSYFGLESSRSPDQVRKLTKLADTVSQSGNLDASIAFLRELAGKEPE